MINTKNKLNNEKIFKISHKLTRIIVNKTGVDYRTQFKIVLQFVKYCDEIELIRAFVMWKYEGSQYKIKGYRSIENILNKDKYYFCNSYENKECYFSFKDNQYLVVTRDDKGVTFCHFYWDWEILMFLKTGDDLEFCHTCYYVYYNEGILKGVA